MADKLLGLLGMARRAGRLSMGFDAVQGGVRDRSVKLVLLAADSAARTEKEVRFSVEKAGSSTPIYRVAADMEAIGAALGMQKQVAVLGVLDEGFAKAVGEIVAGG